MNYNSFGYHIFVFLSFFGQSLFIFVELILNKINFGNKKEGNVPERNSKKESSLVIQYIFNDLSVDIITYRDTINIIIISLLFLLVDSTKVAISSFNIIKNEQKLIFNEEYYFLELLFLYILSYYIYKLKLYKHQYISLILILIFGLIRNLMKVNYNLQTLLILLFQIFITFFESIIILYIKGLMKYKFFSIYKVCYVFGIINSILSIIIFFMASYIPCGSSICNVYYHNKRYFDNIYNAFSYYNISKKFALFLISIFFGIVKLLFYVIINNFTVYHLFLFIQNQEFISAIYTEIISKRKIIIIALVIITYIFEFFAILVFQENIELNFCEINKDIKKNIRERAKNEVPLLETDNNNDSSFEGEEEEYNDVKVEEKMN